MEFKSCVVITALLVQCNLIRAAVLGLTESKIVEGSIAATGSAEYSVALSISQNVRSLYCGGSLITQRTVLTAAHCIADVYDQGSLMSSLRVTVGTTTWKTGGQSYEVSHNVTHPDYTETKNDLGFLYTATLVILSKLAQPVTLDFDYVDAGVKCKVTGWGYNKEGGEVADDLYQLLVTTIDVNDCVKKAKQASIDFDIKAPDVDPKIEICTFHRADPKNHGTCNGDSGGALVRTDRHTQVGSVSWGFPCARGAPDMFVRFSAFKEFITRNIMS